MPRWRVAKLAGTKLTVTGDGSSMQQMSKWCGNGLRTADGDMDILCGALTCPRVILYFAHMMHMFSSKL